MTSDRKGRPNKFDAAKRFDAGCRFALFHDGQPDWDDDLFLMGWKFGNDRVKQELFVERNNVLKAHGFEPIGIVRLATTTLAPTQEYYS